MMEKIHDFFRSFLLLELVKGMALTGRHLFRRKITIQFPEEKTPLSPRFRGLHALRRYPKTAKSAASRCKLCEAVCPALAITIESEQRSDGTRRTTRYDIRPHEVHLLRAVRGVLPVDSIVETSILEYHGEKRGDLYYTKGDAARRRRPLRGADREGPRCRRGVPLSHVRGRRILVLRLRAGDRGRMRDHRAQPGSLGLFLVLAFFTAAALWMLLRAEFLAIALVLVYVGAVMVLFLFVVMMLDVNLERLREGFSGRTCRSPSPSAGSSWSRYRHHQGLPGQAGPGRAGRGLQQHQGGWAPALYRLRLPARAAAVLLLVAIIVAIAAHAEKGKDTKYRIRPGRSAVRRSERVRLVSMPAEKND